MRVLIVDDSPTEMFKLKSILEKHGHEVIQASNGVEGVNVAEGVNVVEGVEDVEGEDGLASGAGIFFFLWKD